VKIAGLYSEMTTVAVKKITSASAAVAGNISVLDGAEIYGKTVTGDVAQKNEETADNVATDLSSNQTVTYTGTGALTVTVPENKTLVITSSSVASSTITLSEGSVLSVGAALSNTLTVKNGDNTAVFTSLPANVQIMKGSIIVVGPLSGSVTVTGDVKLQGSVANNLTITSSAGANVVLDDGFSVATGKTLTFSGVTVSSQSTVQNAGTINFGTGTDIDGTFTVLGGTVSGKVTSGSVILATGSGHPQQCHQRGNHHPVRNADECSQQRNPERDRVWKDHQHPYRERNDQLREVL